MGGRSEYPDATVNVPVDGTTYEKADARTVVASIETSDATTDATSDATTNAMTDEETASPSTETSNVTADEETIVPSIEISDAAGNAAARILVLSISTTDEPRPKKINRVITHLKEKALVDHHNVRRWEWTRYRIDESFDAVFVTSCGLIKHDPYLNGLHLDPLYLYTPEFARNLADFARGGGTVIFGCDFAKAWGEEAKPESKVNLFFEQIGLSWKMGTLKRQNIFIDKKVQEALGSDIELPDTYWPWAASLKDVPAEARLYSEGPTSGSDASVAWQDFGLGWIGFVGDMNIEDASLLIYDAMLGISPEALFGISPEASAQPE